MLFYNLIALDFKQLFKEFNAIESKSGCRQVLREVLFDLNSNPNKACGFQK